MDAHPPASGAVNGLTRAHVRRFLASRELARRWVREREWTPFLVALNHAALAAVPRASLSALDKAFLDTFPPPKEAAACTTP